MTNNKPSYHGDEEVIQRNVERSREVIEAKQQRENQTELDDLNAQDLDTDAEDAPPGQSNTPIGGYSNMNVQGGTAARHKRG